MANTSILAAFERMWQHVVTALSSKANASDLTSHTSNTSNPHNVTLGQLGVTATAAELNKMDGVTATTAELNYVDGVTSNIQTQLDGKAASSHNHAASNITSGTLSSDRLPTVPITKGGTGATTVTDALENLGLTAYVTPQMFSAVGNANYFNSSDNKWYVDESYTTLATDDTQAFTNALAAAVNKTLYIPKGEGEYYLLNNVSIPSNVKIVAGKGAKIVFEYNSALGFYMDGVENITISGNGNFELKMIKGDGYSNHVIYVYGGSTNINIENLIIRDACGNGIQIGSDTDSSEYITIRNVEIYGSKHNNLYIRNGNHILVDNCILNDIQGTNTMSPRSGFCIEAADDCVCEDIKVLNCIANNNTRGQGFFCRYSFKDVTFENCIAENNANNYSTSGKTDRIHENVTFLNCRSIDSTGTTTEDGFVTSNSDNIKLIGCYAEGESQGFNIYTKSNKVIVDSCTSTNARSNAFYVGTPSNDTSGYVKNSMVTRCIAENPGNSGFCIKYSDNILLDSCISNNASGYGADCHGITNSIIRNSKINNSVVYGIAVTGNSSDVSVHSNHLVGNMGCGILIYNAERTHITNNFLLNNSIYTRPDGVSYYYYYTGIRLQGGNDFIVRENVIRITEETDIECTGIGCHLYGQTTNCYVADNDCYNGGDSSYEITGSTDYGNVDGGGNRKKDGALLS